VSALEASGVFSRTELDGIYRQHVQKLLPELA